MKLIEKRNAIALRERGQSIKEIAKNLGVSKASVSMWVRDVELSEATKRDLLLRSRTSEAVCKRREARLKNEGDKGMEIIERAAASIEEVSKHDLRLLGIALYWAEGRKRGGRVVDFSNSDPITIKIMMRFFREICNVPETKFRCHIHTYSHSNAGTAEKYWSTITAIPLTQFYKTYSKPSKASLGKRDSLPHGTLDVYICDTKLFLTIVGWIKKVSWLLVEG